jgi:hypothetical protein
MPRFGSAHLASAAARWVKANWKFNPTANGTFTLPVSFVLGQYAHSRCAGVLWIGSGIQAAHPCLDIRYESKTSRDCIERERVYSAPTAQ